MSRIENLEKLLEIKDAIRKMVEKDGRKVDEERLCRFMRDIAK